MEFFLNQLSNSWNKLTEKLSGWIDVLVSNIPNIVLAAIIMSLTLFLSKYVQRYFVKVARRFSKNPTVTNLLSNLATFSFVMLGLFLILGVLNLEKPLNSLLAGAGVVGLAVGLALQEPLVNIFSGILLSVRDLYNVGDLIKTNDYFGTIQEITLRSTILKQPTGEEVTIPNKMVLQNPLENFTASPERLVVLECGISYGDDLQRVKEVALQAMEQVERDRNRSVQFFYTGFGNSSINFVLRFWLAQSAQLPYLQATSDAIMALKAAFDEADITIPFPIRTLDFGMKGGEKLEEQVLSIRNGQPATSTSE